MRIQELVGKRVLLKVGHRTLYAASVEEYKVLEVSPSGNWVKLMNLNGYKFWKAVTEISFVEELRDLKAERLELESIRKSHSGATIAP